jgi:hypothetical protein
MLDEKEKKEYSAPELTLVELADQLQPLCGSFSCPDGDNSCQFD